MSLGSISLRPVHICPPLSADFFLRLALLGVVKVMGVVLDFVPSHHGERTRFLIAPRNPMGFVASPWLELGYVSVVEAVG